MHPCFSLPRRELQGKNRIEVGIFGENTIYNQSFKY